MAIWPEMRRITANSPYLKGDQGDVAIPLGSPVKMGEFIQSKFPAAVHPGDNLDGNYLAFCRIAKAFSKGSSTS